MKKSIFVDEGYAVYEQQHAINNQFEHVRYFVDEKKFSEMKRFELFPDELIMSCSGTMGKVAKVPAGAKPGIINQALLKLSPREKLNVDFLQRWMESPNFQDQLAAETTGVAIKNVASVKVLKEIKVPLPPLPEQKRIIAILNEAFEGIDRAIANTEKNLANARELFESYLNGIFTKKGDDWIEKPLGEIADFKNGLNFTKSSKGECIRIVGVKDFQSNYWVPMDQLDSVQIEGVLSEAYELQKNDILTVRSNGNKQLIGRCMLADDVPEQTSHSGFTIRIRGHSVETDPAYLAHYLKSGAVREVLVNSGGGTNISSLNQKALASLPVALPAKREQQQIVERIKAMQAEVIQLTEIYQKKLVALSELKQSILQKAFVGELTKQPEKVLGVAVA